MRAKWTRLRQEARQLETLVCARAPHSVWPPALRVGKARACSVSSRRPPSRSVIVRLGVRTIAGFARSECTDLLERVRALASHRLPSGDLKPVLQRGLEAYERELLKGRFAVGKKPRPSKPEHSSAAPSAKTYRSMQRLRASKPSRYVPAAAAREVYARDGGQCGFAAEPTTFGTLAVVSEHSALARVLVGALPSELQTPLTPPNHRRTRRRDQ